MDLSFMFFFNSILLGVGLAMDAFSVSVANGLNEPCMKKNKIILIALTFAVFQALMPMTGWVCVHTIAEHFKSFEKFIPWIALVLLVFIGSKMIKEGRESESEECCNNEKLGIGALIVQGIATSIDALSVGFTIAEYKLFEALLCAFLIAFVTFFICVTGVVIGKKVGTRFCGKANIFGGIILIFIGIEIFVTGIL